MTARSGVLCLCPGVGALVAVSFFAATALAQAPAPHPRLTNVSARTTVQPDRGPVVVGFTHRGRGLAGVILRGVGPGLRQFGVDGVVPEPGVTLFRSDGLVLAASARGGWGLEALASEIEGDLPAVGAFPLPHGSLDAMLRAAVVAEGSYTCAAEARSTGGEILVEVYSLGIVRGPSPVFATPYHGGIGIYNVSVRAHLAPRQPMVVGFTLEPASAVSSHRLLVRGIGPGLRQFGLTGTAAAPRFAIFQGHQVIAAASAAEGDATAPPTQAAATDAGAFQAVSGDTALLWEMQSGAATIVATNDDLAGGLLLLEVYLLR